MARPRDAQLARDRLGGDGVVAGDHAHLDAGRMRDRDGRLRRRPRRIDDAHERQQRHAVQQRQQVGGRVERGRVEVLAAGGHDPQALPAQALVLREVGRLELVGDRDRVQVRRIRREGAAGQQLVGRALDERADDVLARLVLHGMERGHHLVVGVERERGERAGTPRASRVGLTPPLAASTTSAPSVGSPMSVAVLHTGVGREDHGHQERVEGHVRLAGGAVDLALDRIAGAGDLVAAAGDRRATPRSSG